VYQLEQLSLVTKDVTIILHVSSHILILLCLMASPPHLIPLGAVISRDRRCNFPPPYPCALVAASRRANLFFPPATRDEREMRGASTAHRQDQVAAALSRRALFQRHCIVSRDTRPHTIAVYKLSLSCSSNSTHSCKQSHSSRHHRLSCCNPH
jgi:hypothetical protein